VGHGEHPVEAAARWGALQTTALLSGRHPVRVVTDLQRVRGGRWTGGWLHRDTIVFAGEVAETPAAADWVAPADLQSGRTSPVAALALGLPAGRTDGPGRVSWSEVPTRTGRRQRFAAYGRVTDPEGNVLLTLIAHGFPGAGRWHLPGGGTDFGESAEAGLAREIVEETAQQGEIGALLRVSDRHQTRGVDGRAVDWHGVRVVYDVRVGRPTAPRVLEVAGSTAAASWFPVSDALGLELTEVALEALTLP
jgi:ADP-ribose pyrophosphatase YjhB (NUDIX family)